MFLIFIAPPNLLGKIIQHLVNYVVINKHCLSCNYNIISKSNKLGILRYFPREENKVIANR